MAETTTTTTSDTKVATDRVEPIKIKLPIEPFLIKTPEGEISESGQNEIEYLLQCALNPYTECGQIPIRNYHPLPDDFEWKWANNRGTLPKRIQAFYYKNHNVKLDAELVCNLGNLGRQHSSKEQTVVIDFTDDISWQDGDFGDGGSCFWGDKSGAITMIEKNGFACRVYKQRPNVTISPEVAVTIPSNKWIVDTAKWRGYARCWITDIGEKLIVWNGYGENTLWFARILALHFCCSYKRITLLNQGSDDGMMWINGATGYIVGEHSSIAGYTKHDLGWEEEQDRRYWCEVCENRIDEDCQVTAYNQRGYEVTVCEDCSHNCEDCGNNYSFELSDYKGYDSICPECRNDAVRKDMRSVQSQMDEKESEINKLETQLTELRDEFSELQGKYDDLESELS